MVTAVAETIVTQEFRWSLLWISVGALAIATAKLGREADHDAWRT
jgi:hypothetical protein